MNDNSFLDIITNIFGLFILIILYLVLSFQGQKNLTVQGVLLPIEKQVSKKAFYIELVKNHTIPIGLGGKCDPEIYETIKAGFRADMCVARPGVLNKNPDEFNIYNRHSKINNHLNKLSSDKVYLVLLVRPSAFGLYHEVAHKTKEAGFDVGWFPIKEDNKITFVAGYGGTTIGAQ